MYKQIFRIEKKNYFFIWYVISRDICNLMLNRFFLPDDLANSTNLAALSRICVIVPIPLLHAAVRIVCTESTITSVGGLAIDRIVSTDLECFISSFDYDFNKYFYFINTFIFKFIYSFIEDRFFWIDIDGFSYDLQQAIIYTFI